MADVKRDAAGRKKPGRLRRIWRGFLWAGAVYLSPVLVGCMNLSTPVDYVMNLGTFAHDPALVAADDGVRRVVVLKHGLWRSAGSLWKLERALRDHGYEVVNESYPSTNGQLIEDYADRLEAEVEAMRVGLGGAPSEIYFVGHSLGGLIIRHYLSRKDAVRPTACVFIATPHRGAVLSTKRKDWLLFRIFLGEGAALQLQPGDPFYASLSPVDVDCGVIFGATGQPEGRNSDIPGDDDGTVAVDEARLPEARAQTELPFGHTYLSFADESVHQVLFFLKFRRFAPRE